MDHNQLPGLKVRRILDVVFLHGFPHQFRQVVLIRSDTAAYAPYRIPGLGFRPILYPWFRVALHQAGCSTSQYR